MNKQMKATRLSAILFGVLGLFVAILIGGSIFAGTLIMQKSTDATHKQIDAELSADDPSQLEELQDYLAKNAGTIQQTATLAQGVGDYDQAKIIATVTQYANTAGVKISGIDFNAGTAATPGAATGTTAVTPTTPTPATGASTNGGTFGISLASPIRYRSFIVFLRLIETGVMPATITNGIITADPENPTTNVTVTSLTVKVGA